jgi:hypothetical protein
MPCRQIPACISRQPGRRGRMHGVRGGWWSILIEASSVKAMGPRLSILAQDVLSLTLRIAVQKPAAPRMIGARKLLARDMMNKATNRLQSF